MNSREGLHSAETAKLKGQLQRVVRVRRHMREKSKEGLRQEGVRDPFTPIFSAIIYLANPVTTWHRILTPGASHVRSFQALLSR